MVTFSTLGDMLLRKQGKLKKKAKARPGMGTKVNPANFFGWGGTKGQK